MYIWSEYGYRDSLLSYSSPAIFSDTGLRPLSVHSTNIEVSPKMLRKASNIFSSTSNIAKNSPSAAKLRKKSKDVLKAPLTNIYSGHESSPPSPMRPLKKKRSFADMLTRTPSATDSEASSLSTASGPSSVASSVSIQPPKGKKELPRWPVERPTSETGSSPVFYVQGYSSISTKK
jgi:hypothetical protein